MLDSLGAVASPGDLARLLAVPLLGWAALRDIRTRRVSDRIWFILGVLGVLLLIADLLSWYPFDTYLTRLMLIRVIISIGFVAPLCFLFYLLEGFGGADLKALLALSILFPTYPAYYPPMTLVDMGVPAILPYVNTRIGVFSLTILTNTVIVGIASPLALAVRNALSGRFGVPMFLGMNVDISELPKSHGRLFANQHRYSLSNIQLSSISDAFSRKKITLDNLVSFIKPSGFDLDALRMYLRWRGLPLAELRAHPDRYRDPDSVGETFDATDGAVDDAAVEHDAASTADDTPNPTDGDYDDPWAAERFLDEIDGSAYGTDAETLRAGLETVTGADEVWLSPGLPFIVPMFVGLLVALTYGDVLYGLLTALGLA